jgi:hypothetical protein
MIISCEHEHRFASDAVPVVADDHPAQRSRDETNCICP